VLSRAKGGFAAIIVTLLTGVLVVLEITDGAMRRWWSGHSLTTDTVSGLLVLLLPRCWPCSTRKPRPPCAETTPPNRYANGHTTPKFPLGPSAAG